MTQFLKCPDNALLSNIVYSHVKAYIIPELHPFLHDLECNELPKLVDDDGEEVIQKILDKSNNKLRMYGSAKELAGNIKIFTNFTESYRFFQDHHYHINASSVIYNSLNGEKYICKPDIYTIIRNIALTVFPQKNSVQPFLRMSLMTNNYEAIVSNLQEMSSPHVWDNHQKECLINNLRFTTMENFERKLTMVSSLWTHTFNIKCIRNIMQKRTLFSASTPESSPITVRLFEDGEERYVMEAELYYALNRVSTGSERFKIQSDGFVHKGMSFEEVKAKFGDRIQKIEFIRTPILRTKHRAVPIRAHFPEQFVVPVVDFFLEFFKQIIFGLKVFQKYQSSNWENFAPIFMNIEHFFNSDQKQQYFLNVDALPSIKQQVNQLKNYEVSSINEVRDVKKNGFTAQHLKDELKYLGLTETFPEIENYAEVVYKHADCVKKEEFLRTCDLFDAVENCQVICILNRVPKLKMFVHNQKGCGRVLGYKCEHCEKEKDVQKALELQKSLKNLKIKDSNSSISNQYSQPALSAPPICDKCSESSPILVETQNELKISQDQLKEMQQKITNTEKELSDLKKEHDILVQSEAKKTEELAEVKEELSKEKKKNQEKEEEILKASKENEELQKAILQLTAENEANERVIQKLLDRITNSSANEQKTIEGSTPTVSVSSKNAPLVIDCLICSSQIKSGQEVIRCPLCKRRLHSNCAFKWRKDHTQCPACNGDLPRI